MYLGNIVGLIVVLSTVPLFASILRIPFSIIAPVIVVICAIGAYTVHNAMLHIWFMMGFGVVGCIFVNACALQPSRPLHGHSHEAASHRVKADMYAMRETSRMRYTSHAGTAI